MECATRVAFHTMEPFRVTRLVYEGSDPSDAWVVTGIGHTKIDMSKVSAMHVSSLTEYDHGCQEHENCFGHLCITPHGSILPMQSLVVSTPVVKNDIYKAAKYALESRSQYDITRSKEILADSLKKKTGRMRKGILNCHIDGSLRMVITPQTELSLNRVTVPYYLKDKWMVVYLDEESNRYRSRYVQEDDNAILSREPALSIRSVQPVKISFWNETCMGVSPDILKAFDGDYDGDEMHLFPVYSKSAIEECESWNVTPNTKFITARSMYMSSDLPDKGASDLDFMDHTTLSFNEIRLGKEQPRMAEQTRTTADHLAAFKERYDTETTSRNFVNESIRGMADTNVQQLSQPIVGDMSRIAKLAASCVIHKTDTTIGVAIETSFVPVCKFPLDTQDGNSCMRVMSTLCAGAQQITLEAHHAKKKDLSSHDLMSDLVKGEGRTLIILDNSLPEFRIRQILDASWCSRQSDGSYVLCNPSRISSLPRRYIIGAYRPSILALLDEKDRLDVCRVGIEKITRYYSFPVSNTELMCLAVLFSFSVGSSTYPITTREGIKARKLRWTDVMMATSYTGLRDRLNKSDIDFAPIDTVSSCLMAGNFMDIDTF